MNTKLISEKIKEAFGLIYEPVGMCFAEKKPANAVGFENKGKGCIVPLIFTAAKGKTVAFDNRTTGLPCSAFYLGYENWIFDGIECFLSDGVVFGRNGERFIETPEKAKKYIQSLAPEKLNTQATIFKPLSTFAVNEKPELVIFFANADELSALTYALHFKYPEKEDVILTRMMSGCGSIVTFPMKLKLEGRKHAVWGMHDISVRKRLPKELMTLTMPFEMATELCDCLDSCFVVTDNWKAIKERNIGK